MTRKEIVGPSLPIETLSWRRARPVIFKIVIVVVVSSSNYCNPLDDWIFEVTLKHSWTVSVPQKSFLKERATSHFQNRYRRCGRLIVELLESREMDSFLVRVRSFDSQ